MSCGTSTNMKIVSWNINGLQNISQKTKDGKKTQLMEESSLLRLMEEEKPDILCLQEVRCSKVAKYEAWLQTHFPHITYHCAEKKGYSGTMVLSKEPPLGMVLDFGTFNQEAQHTQEGRVITAVFPQCILVNVYTPNSKQELQRLAYRTEEWDPLFCRYIQYLQKTYLQPLVICGDLNVAHMPIDVHAPNANKRKAGFTDEERTTFTRLLQECELIDTFRAKHPSLVKYSYWSNFAQSRKRNKGWRIDYFLLEAKHAQHMVHADILTEYGGSDHAPVLLTTTWT